MTLWTAADAAKATNGEIAGKWKASGVAIDSRVMKPGELYVAIVGERVDAHQFVADALENRGASAAMVSRTPENVADENLLLVDDTLKALAALGAYNRSRSSAKIVGVTGSVGKTSTKELLRIALEAHGETFASHGNFNNHIGTPLNLANLPMSTEFSVFEMGMNHTGEIDYLTHMVRPHVAVITNVEAVHLEFFSGVEAIADAKCEIFHGMDASGVAVLSRDNSQFARCRDYAKSKGITNIISFGEHAEADCRLVSYRSLTDGCEVEASVFGKTYKYRLGAVGRHWAVTSLIGLAVAHALKLDVEKTARALAKFSELPGRGRIVKIPVRGGEALLIDDSYNASPAAMRAAFAKVAEVRSAAVNARTVAALGDMRELGETGPQLHSSLAPELKNIDAVFTAGTLMKHLHDALPGAQKAGHAPDAKALIPVLARALQPGDIVLVKGSHGSHMYEVAEALLSGAAGKEWRDAV